LEEELTGIDNRNKFISFSVEGFRRIQWCPLVETQKTGEGVTVDSDD
jgi:hypothetical protein